MSRFGIFGNVALLTSMMLAASANAETFVWNPQDPTTAAWNSALNWSGQTQVPGINDRGTFFYENLAPNVDLGAQGAQILELVISSVPASSPFSIHPVRDRFFGVGAVGSQTLTLTDGGSVSGSSLWGSFFFNSNFQLGAGADAASYTISHGGRLTFNGGVSGGSGGVADAKTLNFLNNSSAIFNGVISDGGAASLSLSFVGTSVDAIQFNAQNTYTGDTTISDRNVQFGINGSIASSNLTLSNSSLETLGNTQAGVLTILTNSIISLSSGSFEFDDSSAVAWSGGLTINGFDPSISSLRFGESDDSLTLAQLNSITGFGPASSYLGYTGAFLDEDGYLHFSTVQVIPEPGTTALVLSGIAGLLLVRRKLLAR